MDEADKERLYEPVKAKRANLKLHRQGIDLCILYIDVSICMYIYIYIYNVPNFWEPSTPVSCITQNPATRHGSKAADKMSRFVRGSIRVVGNLI